jgi:branched-chain amino acid transport system substrate-binding protein
MFLTISVVLFACSKKEEAATPAPAAPTETATPAEAAPAEPAAPVLSTDKGVDVEKRVIRVGTLNDESGPAAVIGKPFALGKRVLAAQVNRGASGLLPEGWTLELVEKDHGYHPGKSQQAFDAIKDDVLYIGTSFGTPPTLPLRPFLEKEGLLAFPASLSSLMASHRHTPPVGPSYELEAKRAMDWVVTSAGGSENVKAAIIYQGDDYGKDGLNGWKAQAGLHGVSIVSERPIKPGQRDFTADVAELKNKGATHIFMAVLPSATGPILGTAIQMKFMPVWIGATPSWIDPFFAHPKLPAVVFSKFFWMSGLPYWGEDLPGMGAFLAAFKEHGGGARPDFYVLVSYLQGISQLEVAKRAIESGDVTRAGYLKALQGLKDWTAGGLIQAVDFSTFPYVTGTRTRVLKPDFEKKTWTVAAAYADPAAPTAQP